MTTGVELKLVTLEETTAKDLFDKLRRELTRIEDAAESGSARDHVVNAFSTAWHFHAWIWDAIKERPDLKTTVIQYRGIDEKIDNQNAFGAALARRFVPLKICRMIATSSRFVHVILQAEGPNEMSTPFGSPATVNAPTHGLSSPASPLNGGASLLSIMGRPIAATRLLAEIEDYWATLIYECGIEQRP